MTRKKASIIPEKIQLFSMNIFQANLHTEESFLDDPQKVDGFELGLARDIAHNFEEKKSRFRLYFSMDGTDEENELLGIKVEYGIEFHFYVENFDDFIRTQKSGVVQIDAILPATLLGMAYSTSRGIIFERTRGTFFEGILLPVIDPFEVLEEEEI